MSGVDSAVDWEHPPMGLDAVTADLRALRAAAGQPSFTEIARRVARLRARRGVPEHEQRVSRSTVYYCFQAGRSRVDVDMLVEVATALGVTRTRSWAERVRAARAASDWARVATALEEVPAPVSFFTGRDRELGQLSEQLAPGVEALVWVVGTAGVGKTQLVLRWAASAGPGVLIDLRGHRANAVPVEPAAAQYALLGALGVDTAGTLDADERVRVLRRTLARSRRIVILDDAHDERQVRQILGADPAGRVLVTSRTRPDGDALQLGGLSATETAQLLRAFADADPTNAPPITLDDAARLARVSEGLPLAVTLIGGRLATRPGWSLADHVDLLQQRISDGRLSDALRTELELSYAGLPQAAARLLRASADLPLTEIDADVAGVLLGSTDDDAQHAVATLLRRSLAVARGDGRIALHALVRAFALDRAEEVDPPAARAATFARTAQHHADLVWAAYHTIATSAGETPRPARAAYPRRDWSAEHATQWLERNRATILALAHQAPTRGRPDLLFRISEGMSWWMGVAGHHRDALDLHEAAAEHAAHAGDTDALVMASLDAGQLLYHGDDPDRADFHFSRAQRLLGDVDVLADPGLAGVLWNMTSLLHLRRGELAAARELLERAAALHEKLGEDGRLLGALINLGLVLRNDGSYAAARAVLDRGMAVAARTANEFSRAYLLINRAELRIEASSRELSAAERDAREGEALAVELGSRYLEISAGCALARVSQLRGDLVDARARIAVVVATARDLAAELPLAQALLTAAGIAGAADDRQAALAYLDEVDHLLSAEADILHRAQAWQLRAELVEDAKAAQQLRRRAAEAFRRAGVEHRAPAETR